MELFQSLVELRESDHQYFDKEGQNYLSFSSIFEFVSDKFDANKVAYFTGGRSQEGMESNLAKWEEQRSDGVMVDEALTHYLKHGTIHDNHKEIELAVWELATIYKGLKTFPQTTVYNLDYKTAGTSDNICLTSNRKDSQLIISDTKCYEKFETDLYKGRGWLKEPFGHHPNSKFIKTAFQVSYYAYHAEKLTGKKVKELFIHLIQPSTCKIGGKVNHKKIMLPYMKMEIEVLLETFKEQIKEKLTNKNEFVI